jgi:hypothetical protein
VYSLKITEIRDNPDGSAEIFFDLPQDFIDDFESLFGEPYSQGAFGRIVTEAIKKAVENETPDS